MKHIRVVDDEPIEKVYFSIGEVEKELNIPAYTLRFWEREFDLKIRKPNKKDRKYTHDNIADLKEIVKLLKVKRYTIEGAKIELKNASKEQD